ncbi:MAG TPA: glycerol-3-phosphate 1-O-acyltransferase PlsY [Opitutaceae bacterium]|jgi:glycerol-3-phosphate acyltransferase PlsY
MTGPVDLAALCLPFLVAAGAGYVLGSLPFGFLVARAKGVNIFEVGSRSPGATNVRRVLGKGPGNTVFVLDVAKGALAAGWPLAWFYLALARKPSETQAVTLSDVAILGYLGLAFALLGHSFSCFTGFRGGKGVATASGGFLVLLPYVVLIAAAIWVAVFYAGRYVSLASIAAALSLPILSLSFHCGNLALGATILTAIFVVVRHRANLGRLLSGTEKRFERRRPSVGKDGP